MVAHGPGCSETIPFLDTTGAACVEEVVDELSAQGIGFAVVRAKGGVDLMLEQTGLKQKIGAENFFSTLETAVTDLGRENGKAAAASSERMMKG